MKLQKDFDCIEMKDRIQGELRSRRAGMTDDEIRAQMEQELETSTAPIAQLWRRIRKKDVPTKQYKLF